MGIYNEAEPIRDSEYADVYRAFRARGILDRRIEELLSVTDLSQAEARKQIKNSLQEKWLSFKCKIENVHPVVQPRIIPKTVNSKHVSHRFRRYSYVDFIPLDTTWVFAE